MSKHPSGRRDADAPFTLDSGETLGARALRLEHLLFEELYRLFRMEVNDPRLAELVPTSVQMSPDLRNAKVMYALREDPRASAKDKPLPRRAADPRARAIEDALQRVTPFLRTRLVDVVAMKRLPELHFHRDRMAEAALRAQELMTRERLAAVRQSLNEEGAADAEDEETARGDSPAAAGELAADNMPDDAADDAADGAYLRAGAEHKGSPAGPPVG
jgi:ribosome-binding factor A